MLTELLDSSIHDKKYIIFSSNNFPTGGPGATYINLFCKAVKENGGDASVYLFKGFVYQKYTDTTKRKNKTQYGVNYTYLGSVKRSQNKLFKVIADLISIIATIFLMIRLAWKRKRIVIFVYSDTLLFNAPVFFFSKLFHIKLVSFIAEFLEDDKAIKGSAIKKIIAYSFLFNFKYLYKHSDKIIVFSNFLRDKFIEIGYDENNILVQPNLTDLAGWYNPQQIKYTLGYAGTPSKKDGIIDLFYAIYILKSQGHLVSFLVVGDMVSNGSVLPQMKEKCNELNILDQVTFTGLVSQEDVKNYLNSCQILCITRPNIIQTKAGFPTKLGEYLSCKKVVLATKFGDIQEYFTDRLDIVLAETEDPESIAENILWILQNMDKYSNIATEGYKKASQILDYNSGVQKIMAFVR
jgi:glycosyltransferase involved in cell wall biosynthesis